MCFCHFHIADSGSSQGETGCAVLKSDRKKRSNPLIQSVMYYWYFYTLEVINICSCLLCKYFCGISLFVMKILIDMRVRLYRTILLDRVEIIRYI